MGIKITSLQQLVERVGVLSCLLGMEKPTGRLTSIQFVTDSIRGSTGPHSIWIGRALIEIIYDVLQSLILDLGLRERILRAGVNQAEGIGTDGGIADIG